LRASRYGRCPLRRNACYGTQGCVRQPERCSRTMDWFDGPDATNRLNWGLLPQPCPTATATRHTREFVLIGLRTHERTVKAPARPPKGVATCVRETGLLGYPSSMQRRCCSMKWNLILPAMVLSLGLCSQSFGFELLNKMLGHHRGGHGCCEPACCEQQQCCPAACEPQCCAQPACEPACCDQAACNGCADHCGHHRRDLFGGLRGLFDRCRSHCGNGCGDCCAQDCCAEQACCAQPACEPQCCAQAACEPACCDQAACCEPSCCDACDNGCHRRRGGLFAGLFHHRRSCCQPSCCDSCGGCGGYGGGVGAPAPAGDAAPVPPAPMADASASYRGAYRMHNTSMVRSR